MPFHKTCHPESSNTALADDADPPLPDRLVTVEQLSMALCRSPATLTAWYRGGKMPPPLPLGKGKYVWRWSSIERWLNQLERESGAAHAG
jgi:predicted DNA-binding transcriptional regulator AlpA